MKDKREEITYLVLLFWIVLGIINMYFERSLADLSAYFVSMSGFVMTYIWGESTRKSPASSIFKKGKSSKRQIMLYLSLLLWFITGIIGLYQKVNLMELAAYFAVLTPFVGSYIMGTSYVSNSTSTTDTPIQENIEQPHE
jgi:uncharacterized membrane protein